MIEIALLIVLAWFVVGEIVTFLCCFLIWFLFARGQMSPYNKFPWPSFGEWIITGLLWPCMLLWLVYTIGASIYFPMMDKKRKLKP